MEYSPAEEKIGVNGGNAARARVSFPREGSCPSAPGQPVGRLILCFLQRAGENPPPPPLPQLCDGPPAGLILISERIGRISLRLLPLRTPCTTGPAAPSSYQHSGYRILGMPQWRGLQPRGGSSCDECGRLQIKNLIRTLTFPVNEIPRGNRSGITMTSYLHAAPGQDRNQE